MEDEHGERPMEPPFPVRSQFPQGAQYFVTLVHEHYVLLGPGILLHRF